MRRKAPLSHRQILEWADRHHDRTGRWPTSRTGPVLDAEDGTTWEAVNTALARGARGLRGGDSITRFLRRRRKIADTRIAWPDLSRKQILRWIDDHYERTGTWPYRDAGRVRRARGISWTTVDRYLRNGNRVLPGGSSLAALLWEARGVREGRQPLTEEKIIKWTMSHRAETGSWPVTLSGPLLGASREDWAAIDMALRNARRGLKRKTSLSRLLTEHCGERYNPNLARITVAEILAWADRHHRRLGRWPTRRSGPVHGARNLSWSSIDYALSRGRRGLRGGTTLACLLDERLR